MKGGDVALLKCLMRSRLSASIFRATEPVPMEDNFNFVLPNIGDVPFHLGSEFNFPKTLSGKWKRCCQYQWFETFSWFHFGKFIDSDFKVPK